MEQKLSDTLVKAIDRSNPFMQNLQLASRFNKLIDEGGGDADLEDNKEVSITENGEIEITPTEGKDGMKKVTATVNVAGGSTGKRTICVQGEMGDSDGYIDVQGFDSASNVLGNLPAGTYQFKFFSTDSSGTIDVVTDIFADPSKVSESGGILTVSEDVGFKNQDDTYSANNYYSALFQATN